MIVRGRLFYQAANLEVERTKYQSKIYFSPSHSIIVLSFAWISFYRTATTVRLMSIENSNTKLLAALSPPFDGSGTGPMDLETITLVLAAEEFNVSCVAAPADGTKYVRVVSGPSSSVMVVVNSVGSGVFVELREAVEELLLNTVVSSTDVEVVSFDAEAVRLVAEVV